MSALTAPEQLSEVLELPFSDQQLAAITAPLQPGVIIAGAGSGKTTVMAARVVWLVGSGQVTPEQVLGLTFTRKAAAELSGRVRSALQRAGVVDTAGVDEAGEQLVLTYDAFAARLVSEHGLRIGVESDPVMITGASRYRLAARVVTNAAGPFEHLSGFVPATLTERLLKLDAELTSHLVTSQQVGAHARDYLSALAEAPLNRSGREYVSVRAARATAEQRLELLGLASAYADLKRRLGYVEFADQMAVAARLAEQVPAVSGLLRQQFRVVLLDEYQDTSSAQAALLRALFSGPDAAHGRGHAVTAVGDPHQAIYGWRGAAASNILQFAHDFPTAEGLPAAAFALSVNRRSGPMILAAANDLAAGLRADPLLGGESLELTAPPGTPPGAVEVASFQTWPDEVRFIGERIVALHDSGGVASWADVAVLVRRNAQIPAVYADLLARDVPVEIVGLGGLLELPEIVEVCSVLALLDDVSANPAAVRLLTSARWAIGIGDLALLGRRAADLARHEPGPRAGDLVDDLGRALSSTDAVATPSLLEALHDPGDLPYSAAARDRFGRLATELAGLRGHAGEPVLDLVRRVVATLGLEAELAAAGSSGAQLGAFTDAVAAYCDVDGEASLGGLLAYLDVEREHGVGLDQAVATDADSVKLLTVHRAKGLEWQAVFLPGMAEKVFPNDRVSDNWVTNAGALPAELRGDANAVPQLDEVSDAGFKQHAAALKRQARHAEDRLAYVAVTRAKRLLVASTHTWAGELTTPRVPSPYLNVIARQGRVVAEAPPTTGENPLAGAGSALAWPVPGDPELRERRARLAQQVQHAAELLVPVEPPGLSPDERAEAALWDDDLERLVAAAVDSVAPARPAYLSATGLGRLTRDPDGFLAESGRPMPQRPVAAQRLGARFHRWLEQRFALAPSLDLDPGQEPPDDPHFANLSAAFERGQFATRRPLGVEVPFSMMVAGTIVRGRIDAVFTDGEGYLVVDWKTGDVTRADPIQLAVYRQAWAELAGVPMERVRAGFFDIIADRLVLPPVLPAESEWASAVGRLNRSRS
ncbi:UvrD-helicase domain-containing protein [Micropruina sp.]|uniref:UvrD-helicase domain-containing protein n=1 Tax=Micropruina sp. TaxID=2737536 RepID=UPI0039E42EF8